MKKKRLLITLPPKVLERIEELSSKLGRTKSDLIVMALESFYGIKII